MLEFSDWRMLHSWVDQLKLILIKLSHREQSTLYHVGDCGQTQNIQINQVVGENEKCVLFYRKKLNRFFGQPNICMNIIQP